MASGVMTPACLQRLAMRGLWVRAGRTGPITGSSSLFRRKAEALSQVAGSVKQREPEALGPQVQDIPLSSAGGIETLEDILVQVDREAATGGVRVGVNRTRAAALHTAAP